MSRLHFLSSTILSSTTLGLAMAKSCMQAFKAAMAAGLQYKRAPKDDFYAEVVDLLGETG